VLLRHGSAVDTVREALEKVGQDSPQVWKFAATIHGADTAP